MREKKFFNWGLIASFIGLVSCSGTNSWWNSEEHSYFDNGNVPYFEENSVSDTDRQFFMNNPVESAKIYNKRIPPLNSLLVCRAKQCAPAEMSMSREYIFNSIAHLIDNNLDTTALLCEANPQAHVCTNSYLTVPAKIGMTPAYVFFDGVKIVDASVVKGKTAINLALAYNLNYNGQIPSVCKPDVAMAYVKSNNNVVLNGNGFKCDMTSIGTTIVKVMFDIDYIDLDYGYIGGYYSIGLSGPANGGGSGYGIIRLVKDAHPLNPQLMKREIPEVKSTQPVYKPEVKAELKAELKKEIKAEMKAEEKVVAEKKAEKIEAQKTEEVKKLEETPKIEKPEVIVEDKAKKVEVKQNAVEVSPLVRKDKVSFEQSKQNINLKNNLPIKITPDTIVKSNEVIISPQPQDIRPVEARTVTPESKFEEIEIEDLDDYIK